MFRNSTVYLTILFALFHDIYLIKPGSHFHDMGKKGLHEVPGDIKGKESIAEIDFQFNFIKRLKPFAFSTYASLQKLNFSAI